MWPVIRLIRSFRTSPTGSNVLCRLYRRWSKETRWGQNGGNGTLGVKVVGSKKAQCLCRGRAVPGDICHLWAEGCGSFNGKYPRFPGCHRPEPFHSSRWCTTAQCAWGFGDSPPTSPLAVLLPYDLLLLRLKNVDTIYLIGC